MWLRGGMEVFTWVRIASNTSITVRENYWKSMATGMMGWVSSRFLLCCFDGLHNRPPITTFSLCFRQRKKDQKVAKRKEEVKQSAVRGVYECGEWMLDEKNYFVDVWKNVTGAILLIVLCSGILWFKLCYSLLGF